MTWGLLGAFAACLAYGLATVLQAVGARSDSPPSDLDRRLVKRLAHSAPYITGVALDAIGFVLSFAALRTLPLFTVQAIVSSSLAVTAVIGVVFMGARLASREWTALAAVTAGLIMLAVSAHKDSAAKIDEGDRYFLVASIAAVGVVAFIAARRRTHATPNDGWAFGALAGLMFGASGIAARILRTPKPVWKAIDDPALWALALAGFLGLLLYAMALQRGSVFGATAPVVVAETLVPAAIGLTLLGDRPAHHATPVAATGFGLAVAGAVALARYGQAPTSSDQRALDGAAHAHG